MDSFLLQYVYYYAKPKTAFVIDVYVMYVMLKHSKFWLNSLCCGSHCYFYARKDTREDEMPVILIAVKVNIFWKLKLKK